MPQPYTLNLTRNQIQAWTKDSESTKQVERMVALVNNTGFGQSLVADDVVLTATGQTFAVTLPVGRFFVDLVVMVNVTGGTGADGFTLENATTAPLAAGYYFETLFDSAPTTLGVSAPNNVPSYVFGSSVDNLVSLRGFIEVLQAGIVGFRVVLTGAPTAATLLAGSGLTTTIQRGPPLV